MSNAPFEHILCTHCTFGSSALEAASADVAAKVLGYSARAASISDRQKLHAEFSTLERLLYYQLPTDASPEAKSQLDELTAPVRLFYSPLFSGRKIVGLVSYRQFDTANRPSSYFAHFLVAPSQAHGSALDSLQLWDARDPTGGQGWVVSDRADGFTALASLESLGSWSTSGQGWLNEGVVQAFLGSGTNPLSSSPLTHVPSRWRDAVTVSQRVGLMELLVQAMVTTASTPAVVLAVEPTVAAILFFTAISSLPESIAGKIGFTTYESDPFKSFVSLAATTFLHPETDFPPHGYRQPALVVNTYSEPQFKAGGARPSPGRYAKWVVEKMVRGEMNRVRSLCQAIDRVWGKSPPTGEDLDQVIELEDCRTQLFRQPSVAIPLAELNPKLHHFFALRCYLTIRSNIAALRKLHPSQAGGIVNLLEQIIRPITSVWGEVMQDPGCARWFASVQPRDEKAVLDRISRKKPLQISDDEVIGLVASCDTVTKERRLPHGEPLNSRIWGELGGGDGPQYAPPALLIKILERVEKGDLQQILPTPLPPVRSIVGVLKAISSRLSDKIDGSTRLRLEAHIRSVLDQSAGGSVGDHTDIRNGLNAKNFEVLLDEARECAEHYMPEDGKFGQRVAQFINGFEDRAAEICLSEFHVNLALNWSQVSEDSEVLARKLQGWKQTLAFFASYGKGSDMPFQNAKKSLLDNSLGMIVAGDNGKKRTILEEILNANENRKRIHPRSITKIRKEIDKLFQKKLR